MRDKIIPILLTLLLTFAVVFIVLYGQPQISLEIVPLKESWEKVVPHQEVPEGLQSLSAKECGTCNI